MLRIWGTMGVEFNVYPLEHHLSKKTQNYAITRPQSHPILVPRTSNTEMFCAQIPKNGHHKGARRESNRCKKGQYLHIFFQ